MPFAFSTQGQGSTAHITFPNFQPNASAATGGTAFFEAEYELHEMAANGIGYVCGSSATSVNGFSLSAAFAPRFASGGTLRITGADGVGALNRRDKFRIVYDDTGSGTTAQFRLYHRAGPTGTLNLVGSWTGSIPQAQTLINCFGRSTTNYNAVTIYNAACGSTGSAANYAADWTVGTATGSGTTWQDTLAANPLTMVGATGAANSWWINYSTGTTYSIGGTSQLSFTDSGGAIRVTPAAGTSALAITDTGTVKNTAITAGASGLTVAPSGTALLIARVLGESSFLADLDGVIIANRITSGVTGLSLSVSGAARNIAAVSGISQLPFSIAASVKMTAAIAGNARFAIDAQANATVVGQSNVYTIGGVSSMQVASQSKAVAILNAAGASQASFSAQGKVSTIAAVSGMSQLPFTVSGKAINVASIFGASAVGLDIDSVAQVVFGVSGHSLAQLAASAAVSLTFQNGGNMRFALSPSGQGRLTAYIDGHTYVNIQATGETVIGDQPNFGMIRLPAIRAYTKVRTNTVRAKSVIRVSL